MAKAEEKVLCHTPTPGKKPTNIVKWKYEAISRAILDVLPTEGEGVLFKELSEMVLEKIGAEQMSSIGSHSWYTTTVKLDLEYRQLIYKVSKASPQRLLKK